jgi:hypothetical protein
MMLNNYNVISVKLKQSTQLLFVGLKIIYSFNGLVFSYPISYECVKLPFFTIPRHPAEYSKKSWYKLSITEILRFFINIILIEKQEFIFGN